MKIILRKVKNTDCQDILCWRNDIQTRKASFNSKIISYKKHLVWFKKSLNNPDRYMYIADDKKENKIGLLRFDRLNKIVIGVNINVAPPYRGKGFGRQLIKEGCKKFIRDNGKFLFIALVKTTNLPSIKVFKKSGFQEILTYSDKKSGCDVLLLMHKNARYSYSR